MKHTKRLLSSVLALALCFSLLSTSVLAVEPGDSNPAAAAGQQTPQLTAEEQAADNGTENVQPQDSKVEENPGSSGEGTSNPVTPPENQEDTPNPEGNDNQDPVTPPEKQEGTASIKQSSIVFGQGTVAPEVSCTPNAPEGTPTDAVPEISYKIQGADDKTYSADAPTAVGVYTARVIYPETETHKAAQATTDFTIRAYITGVALEPLAAVPSRPYNGAVQPVPVAQDALHFTFQVEGTTQVPQLDQDYTISTLELTSPKADTNAESMNVKLTITFEDGLYAVAPEVETSFQFHADITKAALTVTAADQATKEGFAQGVDQAKAEGLAQGDTLAEITLKASEDDTAIIPEGAKILRDKEDVTDQYEITYKNGRLTRSAAVEKAPTPQADLSYNGAAQNLLSDPGTAIGGTMMFKTTYASAQNGAEELISDWSESIPTGKLPGIYNIIYKAVGTDLKDSEEKTVTATISTKVLKVSATAEKVYDGTASTENANITVNFDASQLVAGEEVIIRTVHGSDFPQIGVGKNLKMTPGNAVLEGKDASNYTVQITSFAGTIQPRPVTVTCKALSKRYGQKDPALTYTAEGLVKGEKLNGSLTRNPGEECGAYDITQGTLTDEKNPNYTITYVGEKLTVNKAAIGIKIEPSKKRVNQGKPITVVVTVTNAEPDLMESGWHQPSSVRIFVGDTELEAKSKGDGVWEAQYTVPKNTTKNLTFRATAEDGSYLAAEAKEVIALSKFSTIPRTGDTIMIYVTLLVVTAVVLVGAGGWYFVKKKKH